MAFTALLRLWQLYHIDGLWLFTLKKPVQFLINIGVKLFFHPFLLCAVFLSSWICFPVAVVTGSLASDPFSIFSLIISKSFSIAVAAADGSHGKHTHGNAYFIGIFFIGTDGSVDRYHNLNTGFIRIQFQIYLAFILVIICQRNKNTLSILFCGNINAMIIVSICPLCKGKACCHVCVLFYVILSHLPAQIAVQMFYGNAR